MLNINQSINVTIRIQFNSNELHTELIRHLTETELLASKKLSLAHNVVSSAPRLIGFRTHNVSGHRR